MISFIIPVKNASNYVTEAIQPLLEQEKIKNWELILIDDHSTDDSADVIGALAQDDSRIKLYRNTGVGKVQALNYGFSLSKGDLIKCVDADDVLDPDFFEVISSTDIGMAHMHDAYIVNEDMSYMGIYHMQNAVRNKTYKDVLDELVSIPRWSWTISRDMANFVFPMPDDLPFEDVWFTMIIKKNAKSIIHSGKPLYHYRQHENQTFGGILNYEKSVLNFRAVRMLNLIEKFRKNANRLGLNSENELTNAENYYSILVGDFSLSKILNAEIRPSQKLKLVLICFFPVLAKSITKVKWKLDQLLAMKS